MKQFKKIASLVMALVMVFAMSATVFAKDVPTEQEGEGTITITNATKEVTYTLYKVFDATVSGENIAYSWPADRTWPGENLFFNKDDKGNITVKDGAYKSSTAKDQLSEGAIEWIKTNGGNSIATGSLGENDNGDLVFTGLKDGYYYVTSSLKDNGLITVTSIDLHPQIIDKNQGPTWDNGDNHDGKVIIEDGKRVIENDGAFTDVVKFDIGVNATNYVGEDKIVKYYIKDTLGEGLEYVENTLKVTVGETELTKESDYTIKWDAASACGHSHGFEIAINWARAEIVDEVTTYISLYDANAEIHVTYEATIDNDAVIAGEGNKNTANYRYDVDSDKPGEDPKYPWKDENQKETTTYTYALGLMKTDGKGNALDGAKFKIYYTEGVGENAVNKYLKADCVVSEIHKVVIKRVPYEKCFVQKEDEYV